MSTSRHLTLTDPATQSVLRTANAIVFMIVAGLLMLAGNVGAGAVFLAIGATFVALGPSGAGPRSPRTAAR
ncbi:hypothetical protein ACT3SQ_00715 [Brachybacterium sp. AOP42-C2-15]|uniref:hypothetical protein n=1 Tax=unclassified Brachybacterium TaxID=2623841 RepID=UPI004034C0BE